MVVVVVVVCAVQVVHVVLVDQVVQAENLTQRKDYEQYMQVVFLNDHVVRLKPQMHLQQAGLPLRLERLWPVESVLLVDRQERMACLAE